MKRLLILFLATMSVALATNAQGEGETPFSYSDELLEAAKHGDPDAMYKIGLCYYVGANGSTPLIQNAIPFQQDFKEAVSWLTKAAKKGLPLAMINLGNIYKSGVGAPDGKDIKKALEWYEKAAKKGYADAYVSIGQVYEKESIALIYAKKLKPSMFIAPEDWSATLWENTAVKAIEYYRKAAEAGSALGAYNLGIQYSTLTYTGVGVARDYQEALRWYRKAAQLGMKKALVNIANMYNEGLGVRRNRRAGILFMKMAAAGGEPMAFHNLGVYYYNGNFLPIDKEKALQFFFLANKGGYNNLRAISDCYKAGVHNAEKYLTEAEWLETVRKDFSSNAIPEVIIPQPDTLFTTNSGYVVKDCGDYYVVSDDGICLTEHRYDKMLLDENKGTLRAMLSGYVTEINEDYSESEPILDQLLDKMVETPNLANGLSDIILRYSNEEDVDYRAIAYYNLGASFLNTSMFHYTELYLKKCLEVKPDFDLAKEQLKLLDEERKERRKASKKRKRQLIMECVTLGLSGLSNAAGTMANIQADKQARLEADAARRETIRQKNKAKVLENKAKLKEGRRALVQAINRRSVSNAYTDEIGLINDMRLNPDHYDKQLKQQIQSHMKSMRQTYGLSYDEAEDW